MDNVQLNRLVDSAFVKATEYLKDPKKRELLLPAPLTPEQRQEVEASLARDYSKDAEFRIKIGDILKEFVAGKSSVTTPDQHVFITGAVGSKQILMDAIQQNNSNVGALKTLLDGSIFFDFQKAKASFTEKTGESLDGYQYGKFRHLFSGMDRALIDYAQTNNILRVYDASIPFLPVDEKSQKVVVGKSQIFAIALTPDQSAAHAKALGIDETQARKTAHDFAKFFSEKKLNIDYSITLLNTDLKPIFVTRNGTIQIGVGSEIDKWQLEIARSQLVANPPEITRPPGQTPQPTAAPLLGR